jgi:hypothetical protein
MSNLLFIDTPKLNQRFQAQVRTAELLEGNTRKYHHNTEGENGFIRI